MEGQTTIKYLQRYLREKDLGFLACAALPPGEERQKREAQAAGDFFRKLVEEVGEVSRAISHRQFRQPGQPIKGTLDEELWDVIYYTLALANLYDVDLERWIPVKETLNNRRYNPGIVFGAPIEDKPE